MAMTRQNTRRVSLAAKDVMTENPAFCLPETSLQDVARMMVEQDCGSIPVVDHVDSQRLVGIITDRDITCRTLAQGKNPLELRTIDAMTRPAVSISPEGTLEECSEIMADRQVRRLPVTDDEGRLVGLVTQAQLVKTGDEEMVSHLMWQISQHRQPTLH